MKPAPLASLAGALALACATAAQAGPNAGEATSVAAPWEFSATVYPTSVRNGDGYTSGIVAANRGALHLEARASYELVGARSAFVGYNIAGSTGEFNWTLTPIIGTVWRGLNATVPGVEASVAYKRFDAYIEAEYVDDRAPGGSAYTYVWSELGYRPREWLRLGAVAQRTRVYGVARDVQRGPFAQFTAGPVTFGAFWFNPGAASQVLVGTMALSF
jgi:hypothetical protein